MSDPTGGQPQGTPQGTQITEEQLLAALPPDVAAEWLEFQTQGSTDQYAIFGSDVAAFGNMEVLTGRAPGTYQRYDPKRRRWILVDENGRPIPNTTQQRQKFRGVAPWDPRRGKRRGAPWDPRREKQPKTFSAPWDDRTSNKGSAAPWDKRVPKAKEGIPDFDDTTTTLGELVKSWYTMDEEERARIQRLLFAGGFYGDVDLDEINFGAPDDFGLQAWTSVVMQAARRYAGGQEITVEQVLAEAARHGGMSGAGRSGGAGGGGGDDIFITLSDPAGLRQAINDVAQARLGRKANAREQQMMVALVHQMERQQQTAMQQDRLRGNSGVGPGEVVIDPMTGKADIDLSYLDQVSQRTVETASVDPSARAEELLLAENPQEAAEFSYVGQFHNFIRMLDSPVGL